MKASHPCTGCDLHVETSAHRPSTVSSEIRYIRSPEKTSAIFTSATLTAEISQGGNCMTSVIISSFQYPYPTVTATRSIDNSAFDATAKSHIASYLGFPSCRFDSPTRTAETRLSSSSVETNPPFSAGVKSTLASTLSVVFVLLIFLSVLAIRLYRKSKSKKTRGQDIDSLEKDHLYFQRKGELEAEERRKFELHANKREHELEGEIEIREMSTSANVPRSELRGEEHCRELRGDESSRELE